MIQIGGRPILWHIMRYYARSATTSSFSASATRARSIKEYFLSHNEALFNDFVLERDGAGDRARAPAARPADDWRITFVDTGINTTIGERLKAVERYLGDDEVFLATYGDGLTDAPLRRDDRRVPCEREDRDVPARSGRSSTRISSRPTSDGTVLAVSGHEQPRRPDQRRLLRLPARDPRLDRAGRRTGRGDVRAADRPAASWSPSPTTASSGRWTRSRTASASRRCSESGAAPWLQRRTRAAPEALRGADARLLEPVARRAAPARPRDRLPRRRHRDRLRRDAAHADPGEPGPRGRLGRARSGRRARARGARERGGVPRWRPATLAIEVHGFRDGFLPYAGGEVKEVFEELKRPHRPPARLHPHPRRPPPGPPPRLRADLEHLPRTT